MLKKIHKRPQKPTLHFHLPLHTCLWMLSCLWCLVGKQDCCLISSTSTPAGRSGSRLWGQTTFFHTLLSWCKIQQRMKDKVRRCLLVLFQHNLAALFYLSPLRLVRTRRLKWSRQKKGRRERADNLFFFFLMCHSGSSEQTLFTSPRRPHTACVFCTAFQSSRACWFFKTSIRLWFKASVAAQHQVSRFLYGYTEWCESESTQFYICEFARSYEQSRLSGDKKAFIFTIYCRRVE